MQGFVMFRPKEAVSGNNHDQFATGRKDPVDLPKSRQIFTNVLEYIERRHHINALILERDCVGGTTKKSFEIPFSAKPKGLWREIAPESLVFFCKRRNVQPRPAA